MLLQASQCEGDQFKAISHVDGPAKVMAGPGTGKTTTLANRIARLILYHDCQPHRILALTFGKPAQLDLQARIASMLTAENYDSKSSVAVMTYHSFGYMVSSQVLELTNAKSVVDIDPANLVRKIIGGTKTLPPLVKGGLWRNGLDWMLTDGETRPDPKQWLRELEIPQETMIIPSQIAAYFDKRFDFDVDKWLQFYAMFRSELSRAGKLTFSDMLYVAWLAMENQPEELEYNLTKIASVQGNTRAFNTKKNVNATCKTLLSQIQGKYDYVVIDESQDTNPLQGRIASQIAIKHRNIMVVGDQNQAIYGFRGATPQYITDMMTNVYPEHVTYHLKHTRRCAQKIVTAANTLIAYNEQPDNYQPLQASRSDIGNVTVTMYDDTNDQASAFADEIVLKISEQKALLSDFGILCRTKRDIMTHEATLFSRGIAYRIAGGGSVYSRKEIKIAMGYMLAALDMATVEELLPCMNIAAGDNKNPTHYLGMEAIDAIKRWVALHLHISPVQALRQFVANPIPNDFNCPYSMKRGIQTWIDVVNQIIDQVRYDADTDDTLDFIPSDMYITAIRGMIVDPYLKRESEKMDEENDSPLAIIEGLSDLAREHKSPMSLAAIIRQLQDDNKTDTQSPAVTLSTVHKAKGLEWLHVFLSSCNSGNFPHKASVGDSVKVGNPLASDERNLFFVAMTRAKDNLIIGAIGSPSIFIEESGLLPSTSENVTTSTPVNAPSDDVMIHATSDTIVNEKRKTKKGTRLVENIRRKKKIA